MNYTIQFEESSLLDFKNVNKHYEKISNELVDKFHIEFWTKIDVIKKNPLHYQLRYRIVRIAYLKVFPYGIHFIIDGITLRVFRVLHHKQYYK